MAAIVPDEALDHEIVLDGRYGAHHSRVLGRQESRQRDHQQGRIQFLATVRLHETMKLLIVAATTYIIVNHLSHGAHRSIGPSSFSRSTLLIARSNATQAITLE